MVYKMSQVKAMQDYAAKFPNGVKPKDVPKFVMGMLNAVESARNDLFIPSPIDNSTPMARDMFHKT